MWLKALIAMTCVAILVAIGWFGWREYQLSEERAAEEAMRQCITEKLASVEGMTVRLAGLQCAFILAGD